MENKELELMLNNNLIPNSKEMAEIFDIAKSGRKDITLILMKVFTYGVIQGKRKERKKRLSNSIVKE